MHFSTLISTAALAAPALAGYVLEDDYMTDFYGSFNFFTGHDPTNGYVNYVDGGTARQMGLIDASGPPVPVKWGVDTKNVAGPEGRASIRLESKKAYNKGLIVIDLEHMPFGCGTWPAFWMFGPNWPHQGEIDILEGVHEQATNALTLHTSTGCTINEDTSIFQGGTVKTKSCDVAAEGQAKNAGCSIESEDPKSYGAGLNSNGGGVYATEWTSDAINIWFFPKGSVPADATGDSPDPSTWGKPSASWVKASCDIDGIFKDLSIIFDTTFCGDWAGATWPTSTCAAKANTCEDYVRDNPQAFEEAFWTVNALKVYQNDPNAGQAPPPANNPPPPGNNPPPSQTPVDPPVSSPSGPAEVPTPPKDSPPVVESPVASATGGAPVDSPVDGAPVNGAPVASPSPTPNVGLGHNPGHPAGSGFGPVSKPAGGYPGSPGIHQNPDGSLVGSRPPSNGNETPANGEVSAPAPVASPIQQNPDGSLNVGSPPPSNGDEQPANGEASAPAPVASPPAGGNAPPAGGIAPPAGGNATAPTGDNAPAPTGAPNAPGAPPTEGGLPVVVTTVTTTHVVTVTVHDGAGGTGGAPADNAPATGAPADNAPAVTPPAVTPPANAPPANTPPANNAPPANNPPANAPPVNVVPGQNPPPPPVPGGKEGGQKPAPSATVDLTSIETKTTYMTYPAAGAPAKGESTPMVMPPPVQRLARRERAQRRSRVMAARR